jgi:hypothetical protein
VEGEEHVLVHGTRRADRHEAPAVREPPVEHVEVVAPAPDRAGGHVLEDRHEVGVGLAEHQRRPRLDDARLLAGDVLQAAGVVDVVQPDVGDDRDAAVRDVGRVPSAEQPDLDHGGVHRQIGEPAERRRREDLEPARRRAHQVGETRDVADHLAEGGLADRFAAPAHALGDRFEVGARVGADAQVRRLEEPGREACGRRLAVGAGDVEHRVLVLRVGHEPDELAHAVERRCRQARRRPRRLEVDVVVEPLDGIAEVHRRHAPRIGRASARTRGAASGGTPAVSADSRITPA